MLSSFEIIAKLYLLVIALVIAWVCGCRLSMQSSTCSSVQEEKTAMNLLMTALFHPSFYQINYFACDSMLGVV